MATESKSNITVLDCDRCNKKKSSHSRGKFYMQVIGIMERTYLISTCSTCKKVVLFRIKKETKQHIDGMVYHCHINLFKIWTTRKSVICICLKCSHRIYFERGEKNNELN